MKSGMFPPHPHSHRNHLTVPCVSSLNFSTSCSWNETDFIGILCQESTQNMLVLVFDATGHIISLMQSKVYLRTWLDESHREEQEAIISNPGQGSDKVSIKVWFQTWTSHALFKGMVRYRTFSTCFLYGTPHCTVYRRVHWKETNVDLWIQVRWFFVKII